MAETGEALGAFLAITAADAEVWREVAYGQCTEKSALSRMSGDDSDAEVASGFQIFAPLRDEVTNREFEELCFRLGSRRVRTIIWLAWFAVAVGFVVVNGVVVVLAMSRVEYLAVQDHPPELASTKEPKAESENDFPETGADTTDSYKGRPRGMALHKALPYRDVLATRRACLERSEILERIRPCRWQPDNGEVCRPTRLDTEEFRQLLRGASHALRLEEGRMLLDRRNLAVWLESTQDADAIFIVSDFLDKTIAENRLIEVTRAIQEASRRRFGYTETRVRRSYGSGLGRGRLNNMVYIFPVSVCREVSTEDL